MFLAITILGGMTAALIALKLWAAVRDRPSIRDTSAGGIVFETTASTIDDYVSAAARWWPHLKWQPTFWVAAFITAILVVLDFHFGYSRGGWAGLFVLGSLFAAADIAIPFVAMKSDKGVARWHELDARDRDPVSWALIVIFTCMSFVVVIGSTAEVASTTGAAKDVGKLSYEEDVRQIGIWQAERDAIRVDRGYQALADLADATEKASEREGGRTRCGDKCEKLKQEAADYRARAADAKRKEELTGKIEAAKARLSSGQGSEARLDADPLATAIDGMTGGFVRREQVRRYGLTVIGVLIVITSTLLWIVVADGLGAEIARERARRAEIADATRAAAGLPLKYTSPAAPVALIAGPQTAERQPDTIVINLAADAMRKRFANDADLLETDGLFGTLIERADGGSVTISALYRAYQIAVLTADPSRRYMTQPTMAQKLLTIAQHRDDVRITAEGMILGWVLKSTKEA